MAKRAKENGVASSPLSIVQSAAAVAVAANVPTILWGPPGTGKSSWVASLADVMDVPLETIISSIREPTDFSGLPIVTPDGGVALAAPEWATRLREAGVGIAFFDEISTAPPAVQSALLRVILERVVGDLRLPDEVRVLACANDASSTTGAWELTAPLANRFCHLEWPVDTLATARGFQAGWGAPEFPILKDGWDNGRGMVHRAVVGTFMEKSPALVHAQPTERSRAGRAWPSPRSWEMAARCLSACEAAEVDSAVADILVAGCVGPGPGSEFTAWLVDQDLPDPEMVLKDPAGFSIPERGDRVYTMANAMAAAVVGKPSKDRWLAGWKVFARIAQQKGADLVVSPAHFLVSELLTKGYPVPEETGALYEVLKGAGLL